MEKFYLIVPFILWVGGVFGFFRLIFEITEMEDGFYFTLIRTVKSVFWEL